MDLKTTLLNEHWLKQHEAAVRELLPTTWTHVMNLDIVQLGAGFKALGIYFRTKDEFKLLMINLDKLRLLLRDGLIIKRNPDSIFPHSAVRYP